jgi:hypothetical protein
MDDNPSKFFLRGKYKKKTPFFAVESYMPLSQRRQRMKRPGKHPSPGKCIFRIDNHNKKFLAPAAVPGV